ncbi:MAG: S41 family peptidase [Planctomycetota bacterium]
MSVPRCSRSIRLLALAFFITLPFGAYSLGDTKPSAGMIRYPDISQDKIVFSYADDLWIVDRAGGLASPLASPAGQEQTPRFSPDGSKIAFVGNYEGNSDLYEINSAGGVAERKTYHPGGEQLCDYTPGGSLLFSTSSFAKLSRMQQLFTISDKTPLPTQVSVPFGTNGAISPDGTWLAYTPYSRDTRTWKRYRGGMASDVWIFNLKDKSSRQVTTWEGTDSYPMWNGSTLYYLSDAGESHRLNIWKYDLKEEEHTQVTSFEDFDVKFPSVGPGQKGEGEIIYQLGAEIRVLNLKSEESTSVEITIPGDRPTLRSKIVDAAEFIEGASLSPQAKRVAVEARGEIWSAPVKNGSPRNLTRTSDAAERDPAWSPDGKWIAYFSDATGEYELMLLASDGSQPAKQLTKNGSCYRTGISWSPNSKKLYFTDKTGAMFVIDAESKKTIQFDDEAHGDAGSISWSHDSAWLAYMVGTKAATRNQIKVLNLESGKTHAITNGYFNDMHPAFDREGKYLYFTSNRDFSSPQYEDTGTTFIYENTQVLVAVPLRKDVKNPLLPTSDEETWEEEKKDTSKDGATKDSDAKSKDPQKLGPNAAKQKKKSRKSPSKNPATQKPAQKPAKDSQENPNHDPSKAETSVIAALSMDQDQAQDSSAPTHEDATKKKRKKDAKKKKDDSKKDDSKKDDAKGNQKKGDAKKGNQKKDSKKPDGKKNKTGAANGDSKKDVADPEEEKPKSIEIDFDGIEARSFQLPVSSGSFVNLQCSAAGLMYTRLSSRGPSGPPSIKLLTIENGKADEKTVVEGAAGFELTPDGKKLMTFARGSLYVLSAAPGQKLGESVSTDGMRMEIDRRAEWKQIFHEAWRLERDFFYDPTMHGVDWEAVRDSYEPLLDDCVSRQDLSFVIREMISEINVGHAYYREGDVERGPREQTGLLGCQFELAGGRVRFAKLWQGGIWDTDARNPLAAAGVQVGDALLAVNGVQLEKGVNPYKYFLGLSGRAITLTVQSGKKDSRQVVVKPLSSDYMLRFWSGIEATRAEVERRSKGKVGYIYVTNTGINGQNDLFRQFTSQHEKAALIIDDRWNGGGQIPTRFIELLNRPATNYWAVRDGADWIWPPDSHQGPKCMLVNGLAGSGGDMFPGLFKQMKLGKLIGRRTWGGLVGIQGGPSMVDGSSVTVPSFAYYETDGTWGIEGHGVDPDIDVIEDPAKMQGGADPQLDVAIKTMLQEIKKYPKPPKRPAYPDRSGMGLAEEDK